MHGDLFSNILLFKNAPQNCQDFWSLFFYVINGHIFLRVDYFNIKYALLCYNNIIYVLVYYIKKSIEIHMKIRSIQINFPFELLFYVDTILLG